jgi:hypothetical protein
MIPRSAGTGMVYDGSHPERHAEPDRHGEHHPEGEHDIGL